jgi:biopolymer transport protein ExbB
MIDLIDMMDKGGPMMYPLMGCSVVAVAVILDRYAAFSRYARVDNRSLRSRVIEHLWEGDLASAALLCAKTPGPVSAVLLAGIQAYLRHQERGGDLPATAVVKEAMDDYTIHAISAVEKRLSTLSTVGNAAPLFGMTGTVTGMITAFDALVSLSGSAEGQRLIARGISEALITTAAGLIIALMAVLPWHYYIARADAIGLEIEETKTQFIDTISAYEAARQRA